MSDVYLPGSCAITYEQEIGGPVTTQHDYFLTALELRTQCNVLVSLMHGSCRLALLCKESCRTIQSLSRITVAITASAELRQSYLLDRVQCKFSSLGFLEPGALAALTDELHTSQKYLC